MGQRANCIIIKNQQWNLFYDHWVANRLDNELFWGPNYASKVIHKMHKMEDKSDWLDDAWCEGGALLDFDRKILLWFGGEDIYFDIYLRKTFLHLLANNWPEWHIWWASEGIADLGKYVQINQNHFKTDNKPSIDQKFRKFDGQPEDSSFLLSIERNHQISVARIKGNDESLELGECQLDSLLGFKTSVLINFYGRAPEAGMHLNLDSQVMKYWSSTPNMGFSNKISTAWPSWTCINISEIFEKHLEMVKDKVKGIHPVDSQIYQKALIDQLKNSCHYNRSNPVKDISERLKNNLKVNEWTSCHVKSIGTEEDKLDFLNQLSKNLFS